MTREEIQQQLHSDLAVKNALRDRGDDENKAHIVEHHFVADSAAALADVAKLGRMLGFQSSEILEGEAESGGSYWYFDLESETSTELNQLARESLLMLALAEAHGVSYDGWGTTVEE